MMSSKEIPERCPECNGKLTTLVHEITTSGKELFATIYCAGDSYEDDGTDCGFEDNWKHEDYS